VIEDAAQAFGASWKGKPIGSFGDFVSFSFHANKNITTAEGGALVLPSPDLIPMAEKLRLQGITRTGDDGMDCDVAGGKANLTDVAARIGTRLECVDSRLQAFEQLLRPLQRCVRAAAHLPSFAILARIPLTSRAASSLA